MRAKPEPNRLLPLDVEDSFQLPKSKQYTPGGSVALDWNSGALAEGLACYRRAEFFLAHEHWESVWLISKDPEKRFLQALIQTTVAFHHLQVGNSAGAASLLRRALQRLETCPSSFGGIAVTSLCSEMREWIQILESEVPIDAMAVPQIILIG